MKRLSFLAWLCLCGPALAQPTTPDTASANVPAMSCVQPKLPERFSVPREDMDYLHKQVSAYGECVTKYVKDRQSDTQRYDALAKAQADAANAAVTEINAYYKIVKAFDDQHKEKGTQAAVGN